METNTQLEQHTMNYSNAFTLATRLEIAATKTEETIRTVDHLFVQPAYEAAAEYIKTDALRDFSTLIAYCIVYANKALVWLGEPDRLAQWQAVEAAKVSPITEPTVDVIPLVVAAPILYALPAYFQPVSVVVEVDELSLEDLKVQAKALKIKGWNMFKSVEKLQAKIAEKMEASA